MLLTVTTPTADILGDASQPCQISEQDSQLLYGETFFVEESRGAYVYGYGAHDGYKGSIERDQLIKNAPPANAYVTTKSTHIYPAPDFKSRPTNIISFLSRLAITQDEEHGFTQLNDNQWVYTNHINTFDKDKDLASIAEIYLGTPYLYGGRSIWGIDCSGLIQNALLANGYEDIPRDARDQEDYFGKPVKKTDIKRNDIVYFKGHVGIMIDDKNILNATARHMTTLIEELDILVDAYDGITHITRVS